MRWQAMVTRPHGWFGYRPGQATLTVVIAANARDFEDWCRDNGRSPRDRMLLYVSTERVIRGRSGPLATVVTDQGWRRRDLDEILTSVRVANL